MTKANKAKDLHSLQRRWHLARTDQEAALTEFEFSFMHCMQAFDRWILQGGRAIGLDDLTAAEIVLLHVVAMMDRAKDASTLAHLLNRDDVPNIQYSLRKIEKKGFILREKQGNSSRFEVTEQGRRLTGDYALVREGLLIRQLERMDDLAKRLAEATELNELLAGFYDVAARRAATFGDLEGRQDQPD